MIIGIGNKARQGKDTAAIHLNKVFGFKVIHFADALYEECRGVKAFYDEGKNCIYIETVDEPVYEFKNPLESGIDWIKAKGHKKDGLPHNAQWFYDGMKEKDPALLQFYGTEFRRKKFAWDYWVDRVRDVISKSPQHNYVIPDTRFKNEAAFIKEIGGEVWRVIRPEYNLLDRDPNHTSEIDLDSWEFDETILNDGSIEDLWKKVDKLYLEKTKK